MCTRTDNAENKERHYLPINDDESVYLWNKHLKKCKQTKRTVDSLIKLPIQNYHLTSDELTGSSACIRLRMSATRTDAFPFALTFGINPEENYKRERERERSPYEKETTQIESNSCYKFCMYNVYVFSLQACEWLLQYAKVSLYHHQLDTPITKEVT